MNIFLAKARNGLQSSPGDKLTFTTWNNAINRKYFTASYNTSVSTSNTSYTDEPNLKLNVTTTAGDLVMITYAGVGSLSSGSSNCWTRLKLISGDGTIIDDISSRNGAGGGGNVGRGSRNIIRFIKANSDTTLIFGSDLSTNASSTTCNYTNRKMTAVILGKTW